MRARLADAALPRLVEGGPDSVRLSNGDLGFRPWGFRVLGFWGLGV